MQLEQQLAVLNEGRAALLESLTCAAESGAGARAALSNAVDRAPPELAGSAVMDDLRKVRGKSLRQVGEELWTVRRASLS